MSENFSKAGKRRGFSLIVVLILSLVTLAIISGVFQYATGSGGIGRIASSSAGRYNLLQDSAETGKAELKKMMDTDDPSDPAFLPRYSGFNAEPPLAISLADDLLIDVNPHGLGKGVIARENLSSLELGRMGIVGGSGVMEVKIYDMQYDASLVDDSIASAEKIKLPPATPIKIPARWKLVGEIKDVVQKDIDPGADSLYVGAYLVRAVLTVGDRESFLDTAIFQSNNAM
jgi:hypothetical protein